MCWEMLAELHISGDLRPDMEPLVGCQGLHFKDIHRHGSGHQDPKGPLSCRNNIDLMGSILLEVKCT